MPIGMDGQRQLLRAAAMTSSKYVRPPESDTTVLNRMRYGVLKGTQGRLHGKEAAIPIGWDPNTGTIRTRMPVLKLLPDDPPDSDHPQAQHPTAHVLRKEPADGR